MLKRRRGNNSNAKLKNADRKKLNAWPANLVPPVAIIPFMCDQRAMPFQDGVGRE
jgi:hypothetical protein